MPDHSASAESAPTTRLLNSTDHFLRNRTYYAIVNPEARGFSHPLIITNEQYGPSQMAVGDEPAIFGTKKEAAEQLAIQKAAFGPHLRVVKFHVEAVFK